jgi:hypothetical protein
VKSTWLPENTASWKLTWLPENSARWKKSVCARPWTRQLFRLTGLDGQVPLARTLDGHWSPGSGPACPRQLAAAREARPAAPSSRGRDAAPAAPGVSVGYVLGGPVVAAASFATT